MQYHLIKFANHASLPNQVHQLQTCQTTSLTNLSSFLTLEVRAGLGKGVMCGVTCPAGLRKRKHTLGGWLGQVRLG